MKKVLNTLILTIVFITSFVVFFPKEKLYYYAQQKLLTYNITIESQNIDAKAFCIDASNSYILLSGSRVATIKEFNISIFNMNFQNIKALGSFKTMVPVVKNIDISYKIGKFAQIDGDFGEIVGTLDLSAKKISFEAIIKQAVRNKYNMFFSNFKKVGDKYVYEINF